MRANQGDVVRRESGQMICQLSIKTGQIFYSHQQLVLAQIVPSLQLLSGVGGGGGEGGREAETERDRGERDREGGVQCS